MTNRRRLTVKQVLARCDQHRARTGEWPRADAGPVAGQDGLTWKMLDSALRYGQLGLGPGSSLGRLLAQHRGKRNRAAVPPLDEDTILAWADAHHARTGAWPSVKSGPVADAPGEVWGNVNGALHKGQRGLPGSDSLVKLLRRHGRAGRAGGPLTEALILGWADAYRRRHGRAPSAHSGPVEGVPGQTWLGIDQALAKGYRGLPDGDNLARLFDRHGRK